MAGLGTSRYEGVVALTHFPPMKLVSCTGDESMGFPICSTMAVIVSP